MRARGPCVQGSDRSLDQGKNGDLAARLRRARHRPAAAGRRRGDAGPRPLRLLHGGRGGHAGDARGARARHRDGAAAGAARGGGERGPARRRDRRHQRQEHHHRNGRLDPARGAASPRPCWVAPRWWARARAAASSPGPTAAPVAAEACESDGTLIGYRPGIGVIHNISRDHGEVDVAAAAVRDLRPPAPASCS